MRRTTIALLCTLMAAVLAPSARAAAARDSAPVPVARPITVFAAASLTNVLTELGDEYGRRTGVPVKLSFAASSLLARQIAAGASADVFVSADQEWMDYLAQRGRLQPSSRRNLLGNRLVLIAPVDGAVALRIEPGFGLAGALGRGRLSVADPDGVPAGRYARAALTSLGVWDAVSDRLVRAEDVRSALAFVARGEAPLGIVYETDARADARVRIVGTFPANAHPPIEYPIALTRDAPAGAAAFVEFLRGDDARAAFEKRGFRVLR